MFSGRKIEREIREDEGKVIILEEDIEELKAKARWTVLAKVNSSKPFSHSVFLDRMKYAWSLARDVSFKAIEENLFVFQFSYLGDWRKVMDEGPWFFRGNVVLLEEYDGITKPSKVKLNKLAIWVHICDLPTGFKTERVGRQIGDKIGETLLVETDENIGGWQDYLRIKIKLNIEKPLTRVVYLSIGKNGKREAFRVQYEKLSIAKFCAICGLLGHIDSECGDGVHGEKAIQYGEWLIASGERQWMAKGSRSSVSTETKGLSVKEFHKDNLPKESIDPSSEESSHRNSSDVVVFGMSPRTAHTQGPNRLHPMAAGHVGQTARVATTTTTASRAFPTSAHFRAILDWSLGTGGGSPAVRVSPRLRSSTRGFPLWWAQYP